MLGLAGPGVQSPQTASPASAVTPLPSTALVLRRASVASLGSVETPASEQQAEVGQEEAQLEHEEELDDQLEGAQGQEPEATKQQNKLATMLDMLQERETDRRRGKSATTAKEASGNANATSASQPRLPVKGRGAGKGRGRGQSKGKGRAAGTSNGSKDGQTKGKGQAASTSSGSKAGQTLGTDRKTGTSSGSQEGQPKCDSGLVRFGPKEISHEKSRTQYLARTGLRGPGQSRSFNYGIRGKLSTWTTT